LNYRFRKNKKTSYIDTVYKNEDDEDITFEIADKAPGPEGILEKKESSEYILKCLSKLSDEHREVLVLRDIKGFAYDEIANILDCSIGTVKSKISRARQKFKDIYYLNE
jgi:RNA polymerase sigma-70 factor (ECF subfamily)